MATHDFSDEALILNTEAGLRVYPEHKPLKTGTQALYRGFKVSSPYSGVAVVGSPDYALPASLAIWATESIASAFELHNGSAARYEILRFSGDKFMVERHMQGYAPPPTFVPVDGMSVEILPEHKSALFICNIGTKCEIGSFLSQKEREELAGLICEGLEFWSLPDHQKNEILWSRRAPADDNVAGQHL